jgi:hypothetical protein
MKVAINVEAEEYRVKHGEEQQEEELNHTNLLNFIKMSWYALMKLAFNRCKNASTIKGLYLSNNSSRFNAIRA